MSAGITLPRRPRGRPSAKATRRYEAELKFFCEAILEIDSALDFQMSSRGWCYHLEEHGLDKGDFDCAQKLINDCRKSGHLPVDICAEDKNREAENLDEAEAWENPQSIDEATEDELHEIRTARETAIANAGLGYEPHSFWFDQTHYVECLVEKIDLRSLFRPVCRRFYAPLSNAKGWPDIYMRASMMARFKEMEAAGKRCVLLYCGDFDPKGLQISDSLRSMFEDLSNAVYEGERLRWHPDNLIIDRFGLNFDFIKKQKLTWIEGLATGDKKQPNLEDERHPDHFKPYVQEYLAKYKARKVEANALVVRPDEGRQLCRDAITKYVAADAPHNYEADCDKAQREINRRVRERLEYES